MSKIKILYYSGHGEVIGGDAQYLFGLIDNLDDNKYEIKLYTDKSALFAERAKQWLKKDVLIHYLDTRAVLGRRNLIQKLHYATEGYSGRNKSIIAIRKLLNADFLLGRSVYRWLNYIYYRIIEITTLAKFRHALHNTLIFYRLFKQEKNNIDILHFNNGGYPAKESVLIAVIVSRFCGIRNIIMTILSLAQPRKWYRISDRLYDYFIPKCCSKIITQAKFLSLELNKRRGIPLDKTQNIFLGIADAPVLSPDEIYKKKQELGVPHDSPLLLISGGVYGEAKGHRVLLKSMTEIIKKYPAARLLIAGAGEALPDFQKLAGQLNINDNVKFLGYWRDMSGLNAIVDIAVVPSIASEGIPYTCLEALRAGKALIVTDTGGCAETVEHEVSGLIIKKNDETELTNAILRLLDDRRAAVAMGAAGRKIFEKKFLLSIEIMKHEQLYSAL
ncbi:MAG: glycosyltransferase [Parcubacteria group bacterium]